MLGRWVTSSASELTAEKESRSRWIRLRADFACTVFWATSCCRAPLFSVAANPANARGEEEEKFLGRGADRGVLEQVADDRQAAEHWNGLNVGALLGDDYAADDHGGAVSNEHFGSGFLRVDGRNAFDARDGRIDLVVLDVHVHVDGAVRSDLRRDVELEHRVNELDRDGVVDDRLHRNLGSLLDDGFLVVLGNDLRLGDELADAAVFCGGDDHVQGEISVSERVRKAAGWSSRAEVGEQRYGAGRQRRSADRERRSGGVNDRTGADRRSATDGAAVRAETEAELGADFTREGAVGRDDAGLDFDLLGFAV